MKFKVLFLDDMQVRIDSFKQKCPDAVIVEDAESCIQELKENKYDMVFLDHDLGGEIYVDEKEKNTGSEVVRFILKEKIEIPQIVVHSHNPDASKNMHKDLKNAGYEVHLIPFWLFDSHLNFQE